MKGIIFKIYYKDDDGRQRSKWIIYKNQDEHLLWFYNPLREMKIESISVGEGYLRMEEKEFNDLCQFLMNRGIYSNELENKILKVTGYPPNGGVNNDKH